MKYVENGAIVLAIALLGCASGAPPPPPTVCPACLASTDIDQDGGTGLKDVSIVSEHMRKGYGPVDVNCDGAVDAADRDAVWSASQ